MPIPDSVIPAEKETEEQAAASARYRAVTDACNALLRKQQTCSNCCHKCEIKCAELQAWLDVGEN